MRLNKVDGIKINFVRNGRAQERTVTNSQILSNSFKTSVRDDYKFDISPRNGGIRIYMGLSRPTVTFSQNTAWKFGKLVSVQNFKLHEKIA